MIWRRDDSFDGAHSKAVDEAVDIISLVGKKGAGLDLGRQRFRVGDVVSVANVETERECQARRRSRGFLSRPPRDRPMAWAYSPFCGARAGAGAP